MWSTWNVLLLWENITLVYIIYITWLHQALHKNMNFHSENEAISYCNARVRRIDYIGQDVLVIPARSEILVLGLHRSNILHMR